MSTTREIQTGIGRRLQTKTDKIQYIHVPSQETRKLIGQKKVGSGHTTSITVVNHVFSYPGPVQNMYVPNGKCM